MRKNKVFLKLTGAFCAVCLAVGMIAIPKASAETAYSAHYTKALELQKQYVSDSTGAPVFGELYHKDSVGAYDMLEIKFDLEAEYVNPFDPDDITVNGVFVTPSGEKMLIPAFYTVPMESSKNGKTLMTYSTSAYQPVAGEEAGWRVRFSGKEIGQYSFYIEVRDSKGRTAVSKNSSFNVTPSDNSGYAVVSPTNPEYFVTDADNKLFYGSGANIAWVREPFTTNPDHLSYDYFLQRAYEEGTNMTRVWMCHYAWLEWMPDGEATGNSTYSYAGLGYYNQNISAAFDRIIQMCEEYDIKVVLTLDDNDEHSGSGTYCNWAYNPYNTVNGGFADTTTEYWASDEAREYYKKRIRYIVARWGYSSSLFSLNLWNDCSSTSNTEVVEYLQELYDYKNSITENFRPILMGSNYNHYTGSETDSEGKVYNIDDIFDYTTQHLNMKRTDKPNLTQECFSSSIEDNKYYKDSLHDTVWSEFIRGNGSTMIWSHDTVDETGSYDTLKNVLTFANTLNLSDQRYNFNSADGIITVDNISLTNAPYKIVEASPLGDASAWLVKATENEFYVDYNDSNLYLAGYNAQLYGTKAGRVEYKNDPTFYVNAPNGGTMMLYVGSRGSGTNNITVTVNGVKSKLGSWSGLSNEPVGYVTLELAKGNNTVHIENTGNDWISVGRLYFVFNAIDEQDVVKVSTLRGDSQTIAYVYNTTYNYLYNSLIGYEKEAISDVNIRLNGFRDSVYEIKMYNPTTGRFLTTENAKATDGDLILNLPAYVSGTDMAATFKLDKIEDNDFAFAFTVDTTKMGSELIVRPCITGNGYRNTGGGTYYYLIDKNGNATAYKFNGERLTIPQNFVGTVAVPFGSFKGNGQMTIDDAKAMDKVSLALYLFGTTADKNDFIINEVSYLGSDLKQTHNALNIGDVDQMIADKSIGAWGQISTKNFATGNFKLELNIPYLEHDMIFSITEKDQYKVEFRDPSGRVHDTVFVKSGTVLSEDMMPELPARTGYKVTGWSNVVGSVITSDTVVRALYEKATDYQFEVTSTNGTVQYPGNKTFANFEDLIRVSAEAEQNGLPFSHWEIDGVKVSASNPYAFRASGSVCLTAVYGEKANDTPGVFLNNSAILTQVSDTKFKFSMIGQSYIPDGYSLVEAGVLLAADDKSNDTLTISKKIYEGRFSTVGNVTMENFVVSNSALYMYKPNAVDSTENIGWQLEVASPSGTDEAVSIHVDASNVSGSLAISPFFKSGDNVMTALPFGYAYLCFDGGNTVKVQIGANGNVIVPAGFKGELVLPFNVLESTTSFNPESFPLYSNLIFGVVANGMANGEYVGFSDLIFRAINDGSEKSAGNKQSPFFGYYEDVYQNFDSVTAENLKSFASTWTFGGYLPTVTLTDDKKVSFTGSPSTNSFLNVKGSGGYDETAKGISLYIDMSDISGARYFRITFHGETANGESVAFYPWFSGKYHYYDTRDNQLVTKTLGGTDQWNTWIGLPAGFVGKVFIPFETFVAPDSATNVEAQYAHNPSELIDLNISDMNIQLSNTANVGDEMIIDDVCFLYDTSNEFYQSTLNSNWVQNTAQDFNNATTETLSQHVTVNSGSNITLTEDGRIRIQRTSSGDLYVNMIPKTTFSTDATGISFHYDASELTPKFNSDGSAAGRIFRVYLNANVNGVKYQFMPWYGKPYYFMPDGEGAQLETRKVSGNSQWNSWLSVKADVSGTYYIPFESMTPSEGALESGANIDDSFTRDYRDLIGKAVSSVTIQQSVLNDGSFVTFDNLCWVYESMFTAGNTEERFQSDFYIGTDEYKVVKVPVMSAYDNSQFMVSLTNVSLQSIRSGRAYIIVRDENDKLHTYYSDTVCVASWLTR